MKLTRVYSCKNVMIALLLAGSAFLFGQDNHVNRTYQWKYQVSGEPSLDFKNYNCDLTIHTWDKSSIEYILSVEAKMKTGEDARTLESYLDNMDFSHSGGKVGIESSFWKNRISKGKQTTMELKSGEKVRYSDFTIKGDLWIPSGCFLNMESKYSRIEIEDLEGSASFDLYNDKLYGGNVDGHLEIEDKYSTIQFSGIRDIKADLYSTDFEADKMGSLSVTSRYSKFRTGDAGDIKIDGYSDKYSFASTGEIEIVCKYTDLRAETSGNLKMEGYDSNAYIEELEDLTIKSKYGKYELGKVRHLRISSSYSDNFQVGSLNSLEISESKYGTYDIESLAQYLDLNDGYSDKFTVSSTGSSFAGLNLKGKYVKSQVAVDPGLSYRFEANVKYPRFDINEEEMDVRVKIKESSSLEMKAVKGKETEGMAAFIVNGYQMSLSLTDN